ncbi:hypothetical protein [Herbaspirillum huttiense]|uniref:hypothetical protein n=1 Tax=Herbaspirillum huttiense TaxID=863372 RepID=UPI0039AF3706
MELTRRILRKMESRRRIGWVDYSTDSYDYRVANARATRIRLRRRGIRMTLNELMT